MNSDIRMPKEKIIADHQEHKVQQAPKPFVTPFEDVLNAAQEKVEKKNLKQLLNMPVEESSGFIDSMGREQTLGIVKETVKKLGSERS